jgi:hypothetical protein
MGGYPAAAYLPHLQTWRDANNKDRQILQIHLPLPQGAVVVPAGNATDFFWFLPVQTARENCRKFTCGAKSRFPEADAASRRRMQLTQGFMLRFVGLPQIAACAAHTGELPCCFLYEWYTYSQRKRRLLDSPALRVCREGG